MEENQTPVPEEVMQMQTVLQDLNQYRSSVLACQVPGGHATSIAKLIEFLTASYKQILNKYNEHPYIKEAQKAFEAEQAAAQAAKAAQSASA